MMYSLPADYNQKKLGTIFNDLLARLKVIDGRIDVPLIELIKRSDVNVMYADARNMNMDEVWNLDFLFHYQVTL